MNAHIWEVDGCENGSRIKESMNELGLQISNFIRDGFSEATVYRREKVYTRLCVYG